MTRLNVHCGAFQTDDSIQLAVRHRPRVVPAREHRSDRHLELRPRITREVHAEVEIHGFVVLSKRRSTRERGCMHSSEGISPSRARRDLSRSSPRRATRRAPSSSPRASCAETSRGAGVDRLSSVSRCTASRSWSIIETEGRRG